METMAYARNQPFSEGFYKGRLYINNLTGSVVLCTATSKSLEGVLIHVTFDTIGHIGDRSGWISESFEPFIGTVTLVEKW